MIFVVVSAFLYLIGCSLNKVGACLTLVFLIPVLFQTHLTFLQGFVWGCLVFSVHISWILFLMHYHGDGWIGYILWVMFLIWYSLLSGLWFMCLRYFPIISSFMFFTFVSRYSLCLLGVLDGYPLFNPILHFVGFCRVITPSIMLFAIIGFQVFAVRVWQRKSKLDGVMWAVCCCVLIFGFLNHKFHTAEQSTWTVLTPWWYGCGDSMFAGYRMAHDLGKAVQQNPNTAIFILPESSFCWDLRDHELFIRIWSQSAENKSILLGGHWLDDEITHNCAFFIHNDKIMHRYCKSHLLPLMEKSVWFEHVWGRTVMPKSKLNMHHQLSIDDDVICIDDQSYQLFLCSELFFEAKKTKNIPIILLWNDTWLYTAMSHRLAVAYITYFEDTYGVKVWHVGTSGITNMRKNA